MYYGMSSGALEKMYGEKTKYIPTTYPVVIERDRPWWRRPYEPYYGATSNSNAVSMKYSAEDQALSLSVFPQTGATT